MPARPLVAPCPSPQENPRNGTTFATMPMNARCSQVRPRGGSRSRRTAQYASNVAAPSTIRASTTWVADTPSSATLMNRKLQPQIPASTAIRANGLRLIAGALSPQQPRQPPVSQRLASGLAGWAVVERGVGEGHLAHSVATDRARLARAPMHAHPQLLLRLQVPGIQPAGMRHGIGEDGAQGVVQGLRLCRSEIGRRLER